MRTTTLPRAEPRRRSRRALAALGLLVALTGGGEALAQRPEAGAAPPTARPQDLEGEAAASYRRGLELYRQGHAADALVALEASRTLAASPNTELVLGHALRQLGRRVDAMRSYERAIASGGERLRAGEPRFRATVADAGRYLAMLGAELAQLRVTVVHPPASVVVTVDGVAQEASPGPPGALTVRLWHEPGSAAIEVVAPAAAPRTGSAYLVAGVEREVRFDLGVERARPSGPPVASWIAGGVGVAGAVVFGVFGAAALSEKNDLQACSPRCPPSQYQAEADRGQAHQAVANVGLVVAGAALATAGVVWLVAPRAAPSARSARPVPEPRAVGLELGPGALKVEGTF